MYSVFIKDCLDVFPRDQILVVRFEYYIVDSLKILNEIYDFLGIGESLRIFKILIFNRPNMN